MAKKCEFCGITTGRGKRHLSNCKRPKASGSSTASTVSGGMRIDGRTSIPKLLEWQGEIEKQLKGKKPADVKAVKKAIAAIENLEEQLAEAKQLAGI